MSTEGRSINTSVVLPQWVHERLKNSKRGLSKEIRYLLELAIAVEDDDWERVFCLRVVGKGPQEVAEPLDETSVRITNQGLQNARSQ
jgi:hypothetical protein